MTTNISNLTKALLKAQTQMGGAVKGAKNPFFKSNYADLPTVMEVVKGPLNDNGIIVLQPALHKDGKNFISTTLIHAETGESLTSETEVVCAKQNDPQAFGAAQTYARRFGLQSLLFIPAEDDDGNYASGRSNSQGKPVASVPTTGNGTYAVPKNSTVTVEQVSTNAVVATVTPTQMEPFKKTSSFSKKKKESEVTTNTTTIPKNAVVSETTDSTGW